MCSKFKIFIIFVALLSLFVYSSTANAQINNQPLAAMSPNRDVFGLPLWFQGQNGMRIQVCLDLPTYNAFGIVTADPCLLDCITPGPDPLQACAGFDPRQPLNLPATFVPNVQL